MGMSMFQFYSSWWLFYAILVTLYSLIWMLMTKSYIGPDVNFLIYFFFYWLLGLFFLSFGIFITSFFSKAKPGVLCAIVCYFFMVGSNIASEAINGTTITSHFWFSLVPITGL